jgi:hypothetical protein
MCGLMKLGSGGAVVSLVFELLGVFLAVFLGIGLLSLGSGFFGAATCDLSFLSFSLATSCFGKLSLSLIVRLIATSGDVGGVVSSCFGKLSLSLVVRFIATSGDLGGVSKPISPPSILIWVVVLAPTGNRHVFLDVVESFMRMLMGSPSVSRKVRLRDFLAGFFFELTAVILSAGKASRFRFDREDIVVALLVSWFCYSCESFWFCVENRILDVCVEDLEDIRGMSFGESIYATLNGSSPSL